MGARGDDITADREGTERGWVDGIRRGDPAAFEALVRAYGPQLVPFAFGLVKDEVIAEDVVQEVFWRIWDGRAGWNVRGALGPYLYIAVRNRALHALRGQRTRQKHAFVEREAARHDVGLRAAPDPAAVLVEREAKTAMMRTLRDAFQQLTERQQTALRLRYEEGMSYREVGAVLGVTESGVDQLLGRAMRVLRAAMRPAEPE